MVRMPTKVWLKIAGIRLALIAREVTGLLQSLNVHYTAVQESSSTSLLRADHHKQQPEISSSWSEETPTASLCV